MVTIEGIRTVVIECRCFERTIPEGFAWSECPRCGEKPVYKRSDDRIQRHLIDKYQEAA